MPLYSAGYDNNYYNLYYLHVGRTELIDPSATGSSSISCCKLTPLPMVCMLNVFALHWQVFHPRMYQTY